MNHLMFYRLGMESFYGPCIIVDLAELDNEILPYTKEYLIEFKNRGILQNVKEIIVGKPVDEVYYEEYKDIWKEIMSGLNTPVLYNMNFGHSVPRCIIQYGAKATVDFDKKKVTIDEATIE